MQFVVFKYRTFLKKNSVRCEIIELCVLVLLPMSAVILQIIHDV
jgi:hypothetical protein